MTCQFTAGVERHEQQEENLLGALGARARFTASEEMREDKSPENHSCTRFTWHLEPSAQGATAPEHAPCSETQDASGVAVDTGPPLPAFL